MKDFLIWCETEEEKNKVLQKMEDEDIIWHSGHLPTKWCHYHAPLALSVRAGRLGLFPFSKEEIELGKYGQDFVKVTPEEYLSGGKKEMKKSDLTTGYVVMLRNGTEFSVALNTNFISNPNDNFRDILFNGERKEWYSLNGYTEDLLHKDGVHSYDIVKVYKTLCPQTLSAINYEKSNRKLLWQREEPKELTIKQIEEILGYSIKIIKE